MELNAMIANTPVPRKRVLFDYKKDLHPRYRGLFHDKRDLHPGYRGE